MFSFPTQGHSEHGPTRLHCATSHKVAGSMSGGVTGISPSGRTMTLESTQPLTEMSTGIISSR